MIGENNAGQTGARYAKRFPFLAVALALFGWTVVAAPLMSHAQTTPQPNTEGKRMEKVTGIGGFFFRAHDPDALARWYADHLGVSIIPTSYGEQGWQQEAGPTAFAPFPDTSDHFGDPHKVWMLNFRVRSLDRMVAQLQAAGITVKVDPQHYPNGRFAHLKDPEGNPLELWEPAAAPAEH